MGLEQREEGKFITILGGKFSQRVPEGTDGAVQRTNKLGKVVWEKYYDSFTGYLTSIKIKDSDYGQTWNLGFKAGDEHYTIQLSYSNSFATAFLKMLPNIDLSKPMKLSPSTKEVDGKNKSSLFINQDDKPIKHAYTRDNPNGLPDMEEITVKGTKVWDDTKRLEFLRNMVETTIIPKLGGTQPVDDQITVEAIPEEKTAEQQAVEDLPW